MYLIQTVFVRVRLLLVLQSIAKSIIFIVPKIDISIYYSCKTTPTTSVIISS